MSEISGIGVPTNKTEAKTGDYYTDKSTGVKYKCVMSYVSENQNVNDVYYKWVELPVSSGSQVSIQPDYSQNDTAAKDYIKNRPGGYDITKRDLTIEWDGNTEGRIAVDDRFYLVSSEVPSITELNGGSVTIVGDETYLLNDETLVMMSDDTIAGVEGAIIVALKDDAILEDFVFPKSGIYFFRRLNAAGETIMYTSSLTISECVSPVKIPKNYLDIDTSGLVTQTQLQTIQTTVQTAQTTAETAQTTAETALTKIHDGFSKDYKFTFDKQIDGLDTFRYNAFSYYKISDFNPVRDDVIGLSQTRESGDEFLWTIKEGVGATKYGFFIIVNTAGRCKIGNLDYFLTPSAGLYAQYAEDNPRQTAGTVTFTVKSYPDLADSVVLKSSTVGSEKKFKISITDNGTISAVEL